MARGERGGRLPTRDEVHAAHAAAHPLGLLGESDILAFGARHPDFAGSGKLLVGLRGRELVAGRSGPPYAGRGAVPDPDDFRSWTPVSLGDDRLVALGLIGVGSGDGEMPAAIGGHPPLVEPLARALVDAWAGAGVGDGDPDALLFEAREREQGRLDEAGLGVLLAALPPGLGTVLDARGDMFGDRAWNDGFVAWCLSRDGRTAAAARLGDLVSLVETGERDEDPTDFPDAASYVHERVGRWMVARPGGEGWATRGDADWLVGKFARTERRGHRATAVPITTARRLLRARHAVEEARLAGPADARGLVDLERALDEAHAEGMPDLAGMLSTLALCAGDAGYGRIARDLEALGGRRGLRRGVEHLLLDGGRLRAAVRDGLVRPLLVAVANGLSAQSRPDWDALSKATEDLADAMAFGGRGIGPCVEAASGWTAHGSPAYRPGGDLAWISLAYGRDDAVSQVGFAAGGPGARDVHASLSPYLAEDWRGDDGLARLRSAVEALAPRTPAAAALAAAPGRLARLVPRFLRRAGAR